VLRVTAGKYKGRRLVRPAGAAARPTGDKVKEALFGAIQFKIEGIRVLDAFAGSGALGIEALSRGAGHVDFVEKDKRCIEALRQNIESVGAQNCRLHKGDVFALIDKLGVYELLLADPPYDSNYYGRLLCLAKERRILKQGSIVVMETHRKFAFTPPLGYNLTKRADYGDTSLWYLVYGEKCE